MCKAANKAISLLQVDSRTADVAATFTSHAPGNRGQHVVEIFAMDVDDAWTTTLTSWDRHVSKRHNQSSSCTLKITIDSDVSSGSMNSTKLWSM